VHGEPFVATQCRNTADASQDLRFQCDADVDGRSDGTQQDEDTLHASVYYCTNERTWRVVRGAKRGMEVGWRGAPEGSRRAGVQLFSGFVDEMKSSLASHFSWFFNLTDLILFFFLIFLRKNTSYNLNKSDCLNNFRCRTAGA
jgi:hypothetical protein